MGTTTIRFNVEEEKIVNDLAKHYNMKQSTVIKKAIFGLYEDMKDMEEIEKFEEKKARGEVEWIHSDQFMKEVREMDKER